MEREQNYHPRVSIEEDILSLELSAAGIHHERQVVIQLGQHAAEAGTPYYKVDFLIGSSLIVEVDGRAHKRWKNAWDALRDLILKRMGFRVIHLTNDEVNRSLSSSLARIQACLRRTDRL